MGYILTPLRGYVFAATVALIARGRNTSNSIRLRRIVRVNGRGSWHPSRIVWRFLDWRNCRLGWRHRVRIWKSRSCHSSPKMRKKCERSSDRRSDWKKPLPRDQIEGVESFTGLRIHPNAVRSAVVGEVAIRRGETYSGRGLRPSGDGRKHGDGDRLAGSR